MSKQQDERRDTERDLEGAGVLVHLAKYIEDNHGDPCADFDQDCERCKWWELYEQAETLVYGVPLKSTGHGRNP